jgi:glycosyltransferase involved in cell wall biosynthesis
VVIPVYNEGSHLRSTLESVREQTYCSVLEVLVADGRSSDATVAVAREFDFVRVIGNPARIQSAGLNLMLGEARGEVVVRVDGHCVLAADYIEACVDALETTGAAMVGGAMTPVAETATQRGIARAMTSRLGAGPARFHTGGPPGWVDTVYLGAYWLADALAVGGYAEDVGVNEDAEFAIRMGRLGGVWFDPRIRSSYSPRASARAVARQFYRYGRSRAATVQRHPTSLKPRQLIAPLLLLGLASPWRRKVLAGYAPIVAFSAARHLGEGLTTCVTSGAILPVMHLSWGVGFLEGVLRGATRPGSVPSSVPTVPTPS